jgi:ATP-binding cassette subfamily F protein 3
VSHDIEFVSDVAETIISMENKGIRKYYGDYDYYIEKSQQFIHENRDVPNKSLGSEDDSKKSAKQQRKERAEHRQSLQKEKKTAEQRVNKLEKELEVLEQEKEEIHEALLGNGDMLLDYPTLNKKLHDITQQIEVVSQSWEESAEALEEILEVYNSIT